MNIEDLKIGTIATEFFTQKQLPISNIWKGEKGIMSVFDGVSEIGRSYVFFDGEWAGRKCTLRNTFEEYQLNNH